MERIQTDNPGWFWCYWCWCWCWWWWWWTEQNERWTVWLNKSHCCSTCDANFFSNCVVKRIHFKTCVLVNKCRNHTAPSYLTEMCVPVSTVSSRRHLRSAAHYDMTVPRTRLIRYGPRSFAVSGPVLWNSLPAAVRDPALTVPQFLRRLKIELFSRAYWLSSQRLVMAFALRLREQQEPYHHHHMEVHKTADRNEWYLMDSYYTVFCDWLLHFCPSPENASDDWTATEIWQNATLLVK